MSDHEMLMELWSLNGRIAALRYKYYELLLTNRNLSMKLFGYRSANPEKFPEGVVKRMEFYVFAGRNREDSSGIADLEGNRKSESSRYDLFTPKEY